MKIIQAQVNGRTVFVNGDQVTHIEFSEGEKTYANVFFSGLEQDGKPRLLHIRGEDALAFIGKIRILASQT
jgi:hypothetical protein